MTVFQSISTIKLIPHLAYVDKACFKPGILLSQLYNFSDLKYPTQL